MGLLQLPHETLDRIFRQVDPADLPKIALACRHLLAPARRAMFVDAIVPSFHTEAGVFLRSACDADPRSTLDVIDTLTIPSWSHWKVWFRSLPLLPSLRMVHAFDTESIAWPRPEEQLHYEASGQPTDVVEFLASCRQHPRLTVLQVGNPARLTATAQARRLCPPLPDVTLLAFLRVMPLKGENDELDGTPFDTGFLDGVPSFCPKLQRLFVDFEAALPPDILERILAFSENLPLLADLRVTSDLAFANGSPLPILARIVRRMRCVAFYLTSRDPRPTVGPTDPSDLFSGCHPRLEYISFRTLDATTPAAGLFRSIAAGNFPALLHVEVAYSFAPLRYIGLSPSTRDWLTSPAVPVNIRTAFVCAAYLRSSGFRVHFCDSFLSATVAWRPPVKPNILGGLFRYCDKGWEGTEGYCKCSP